jgi:phosphatidylinositol alpha-1,6-mannosyltransferase
VIPEGFLATLLGLPFFCYVHGEELGYVAGSKELSWLAHRVFTQARSIIPNSHNTFQILREKWLVSPERMHVFHPGVDTETFIPAPADPVTRKRLGWDGRTVVLTVGRLQKRKGHDVMIRALPLIRRAVPDVLYAIVGAGEEKPYLEALVRDQNLNDSVQFLGELADAPLIECYQQCDLFVLPNREVNGDFEGFGMVLVEAQACGKAVVAGKSGGTGETMREGETGILVHCEEPEELARTVTQLLQQAERRTRMGAAGRPWVVEQFDWNALAARARKLFGFEPQSITPCLVSS